MTLALPDDIDTICDTLNCDVSRDYNGIPDRQNVEGPMGTSTPPLVGPVLTALSSVEPQAVRWLWKDRIALGKLNLIFGDPGLGKSFLTIDLAARVTTCSPLPDGTFPDHGSVILISAEDDLADTIRPRLDKAGADVSRVHALEAVRGPGSAGSIIERSFTLADVPHLRTALERVADCKLVVIDPVSAFIGGKADAHRNDEVRGLLTPLSQLAAEHGVAVVMVTHMSKGGGGRALYRAMGSLAFAAAARSAWLVIRDETQPARRMFLPAKNNIGDDTTGFAYSIIDGAIAWEREPVLITADQAVAASTSDGTPGPEPEARKAAEEWLAGVLADGAVECKKVEQDAKDAGIKYSTLRRAKDALGVRSERCQYGGAWTWRLPKALKVLTPLANKNNKSI